MGVKGWSERVKEMIQIPQRDYRNDPKVTLLTRTPNHYRYQPFLRTGLQIDDDKERDNPTEDAKLDEVIFDKRFCGTAAETENYHVL